MMLLMERKDILLNDVKLSSLIYKNRRKGKRSNIIKVIIFDNDGEYIKGSYKKVIYSKEDYEISVKRAYRVAIGKYLRKHNLYININYVIYKIFEDLLEQDNQYIQKRLRALKKRDKKYAKKISLLLTNDVKLKPKKEKNIGFFAKVIKVFNKLRKDLISA